MNANFIGPATALRGYWSGQEVGFCRARDRCDCWDPGKDQVQDRVMFARSAWPMSLGACP